MILPLEVLRLLMDSTLSDAPRFGVDRNDHATTGISHRTSRSKGTVSTGLWKVMDLHLLKMEFAVRAVRFFTYLGKSEYRD
jgi:hypothetical protein